MEYSNEYHNRCNASQHPEGDFNQDTTPSDLTQNDFTKLFESLKWLKDMNPRSDNQAMQEIIPLLLAVQYDKEGSYGNSWCKHGEVRSILPNIDRKYDRLDTIVQSELNGSRPKLPNNRPSSMSNEQFDSLVGESKIDAVADLANYCILYMGWLKKNYPDAFDTWVRKNVPGYAW